MVEDEVVVGFDPAAGEDSTVVLQRWQKELFKKIAKAYSIPTPLLSAMPRTPAKGKVHRWMAHRAAYPTPFPYGTIIRPTAENKDFPEDYRQMVIGIVPRHNGRALAAMGLNPPTFYVHLLQNIHGRWEEDI